MSESESESDRRFRASLSRVLGALARPTASLWVLARYEQAEVLLPAIVPEIATQLLAGGHDTPAVTALARMFADDREVDLAHALRVAAAESFEPISGEDARDDVVVYWLLSLLADPDGVRSVVSAVAGDFDVFVDSARAFAYDVAHIAYADDDRRLDDDEIRALAHSAAASELSRRGISPERMPQPALIPFASAGWY